jgi:hypothetical protein
VLPAHSLTECSEPSQAAEAKCPNCDAFAPANFCGECGQKQEPLRLTLRQLAGEAVDELLQLDSKIVRTLRPLFFQPGFLTREYLQGRRVRYVRPFRLFLVATVVSFVLLAITTAGTAAVQVPSSKAALDVLNGWANLLPGAIAAHAHRFLSQGGPAVAKRILDAYLTFGPKVQLLAVPLYAVLLVGVYRDAKRTYAEHFVFALHFHAFYFGLTSLQTLLALTHLKLLMAAVGTLFGLGSWVYLFLALRTVYPAGRIRTLWRTVQLVILNLFVQGFLGFLVIAAAVALA